MDRIEFYRRGSDYPFTTVASSIVPSMRQQVYICGFVYQVVNIRYTCAEGERGITAKVVVSSV